MKTGIGIAGYPGAGKSLVAEILQDKLYAEMYETGDVVRRGAARHFECPVDELSSDELGEYSTMRREEDGGDYVLQDLFENLERNPHFPRNEAIFSGVRDSVAPKICRDYFDQFLVVWVEADFNTRLERLQSRGRQDEAGFTAEDLRNRDIRENKWGTKDIFDERDVIIRNEGTIPELTDRLDAVEYLL